MVKRYSIDEIQNSLPNLVQEAEGGPRDEKGPVIGSSLDHLIGRWSAQDEREFLHAIEVFEQVDEQV